MCNHKRIVIIPSEENSGGIADTYHIKCTCCDKTLYENVLSSKIKEYIEVIHPVSIEKSPLI